jgi:hypothetical protein
MQNLLLRWDNFSRFFRFLIFTSSRFTRDDHSLPVPMRNLTEAERLDRRKGLLMAGGLSEKEAEIAAEISAVPRQFRGPRNGH